MHLVYRLAEVQWGEYRTKRMVLGKYEELEGRFGAG
jgi:hypothetical protein